MLRYENILLAILLCSIPLVTKAFDKPWAEKQKKSLEALIKKSGIPEKNLAIYVAGGEGEPIVVTAMQAEKKMTPASVTKLVTAAAVLNQFPPGSKFKTTLLSSAKVENGTLKGDLILKGGGDPSFVSETMWYLVNIFKRTGIQKIQGDIVVDDHFFDQVRFDESRQKERVDRAYDAPAGAMSFNWNSANIFVRPGDKVGGAANVFVDPENDYIELKAKVKTVKAGGKTAISIDRDKRGKGVGDLITVRGQIALDSKETVAYKNVTQPDLWSGSNLKSFLKQRDIEVTGKVRSGITPSGARLLAEAEGKLIEDVLADMDKFSNNYVAEMLAKDIAASIDPPGTLDKGMKALNSYMTRISVPSDQYELVNPSGLTRDNKMSAFALWKVLNDMHFQFKFQPEFTKSLPIAGIDGTLKNRMRGTPAERWVRAKTGFLTGVVSLAGYAGRADGTVLPFVFLFNGSADESHVRSLFDRMATSLVE
ncbi:MAG: D-alanyl-D-alanine carboxypeptidase/D-alanyl-D-alanine-endopeptidase [Bdellovibrio sp. CG10_big_fil_rev_8_21_14_0_10_47_8]|nr:MAG: D-alanyl-D-alanine carboxypeptidase/D-alanyl-D-alanine-endopeptidase [Bdellovibrio sp. CG10_big_fil_rev_8_21_14_0_10_47_8]